MILEKDDFKGESVANAIDAAAKTIEGYFEDIFNGDETTDFYQDGQ